MEFILASASPRRKEILENFGYSFEIVPSDREENADKHLAPPSFTERLALVKAEDVFERTGKTALGADTIVVLDGEILGKPKNLDDELNMLSRLNNRKHIVVTGYALIGLGVREVGYDLSEVLFNELSQEQMRQYAESGLGFDKAGGYGIQDEFGLVKSISGSYYNVMGLPIEKIETLFERYGVLRK